MLDSADPKGFESIVSWLPDGISFKVHNSATFVGEILPQFFLQTKYKSFQRQLNTWGFERIVKGPNKGGYNRTRHFVKGNATLVNVIKRRKPQFKKAASLTITPDAVTPPGPKKTTNACAGVCEEKPQPTTPSSKICVSKTHGEDQNQDQPQKRRKVDHSQGESAEVGVTIPSLCDDDVFGLPGITAENCIIDSMLFEGTNLFKDYEEEAASNSTVHLKRIEEKIVLDLLAACERGYTATHASINLATYCDDHLKSPDADTMILSSEDGSRTCQKFSLESQNSLQNRDWFLAFASTEPRRIAAV